MPTPTPITTIDLGSSPVISAKIVHHEGFDYGIDEQGPYRSIVLQVDEKDSTVSLGEQYCDLAKGTSDYSSVPHAYAAPLRYPNNTNLICTSIGLHAIVGSGEPAPTGQKSNKFVHLLAKFRQLSWDVDGSNLEPFWGLGYPVPWASLDVDESREEYARPGEVTTATNGTIVKQSKIMLPVVTYTIRRSMIPDYVAYDAIAQGFMGKVNTATFMGKARGTLLFETFAATPDQDPSGVWVWVFTLVVKWRPIDWNKAPDYDGTWDFFRNTPTGPNIIDHPYADPTPLLSYGIIP